MFIDEVIITVKAGNGGDGSAAFRREKFVQFGGPDGGDGGKGGDVIFVADPNINTLIDFKFKKLFKAQNGENGQKKQMYGKTGENLIIKVPVGTQVRDVETGKLLLDLNVAGEERVLLRGGKGGLGNVHFKSSIRKTPKIAGKGREGAELKVKLELKLIADVALVGYPSVGKSSFINRVSAANSKVGSYHFTTLEPKLGVVRLEEGKSFVIADIPGLIEGAHEGVGLGDKFLRHIERCKMIYHLVDVAEIEGRDAIEDYEKINTELRKFSEKLANKKQIVLANKMDLLWDMDWHWQAAEPGGQPMWGCLRPLWRRDCARMQWQEPAQGELWQDFLPPECLSPGWSRQCFIWRNTEASIWTRITAACWHLCPSC